MALRRLWIGSALVAWAAAAPAAAQLDGFERAAADRTIRQALESDPRGEVRSWSAGGASGTITIVRDELRGNRRCRTYRHNFSANGQADSVTREECRPTRDWANLRPLQPPQPVETAAQRAERERREAEARARAEAERQEAAARRATVERVQQGLIDLLYLEGRADGSLGNKTNAAIAAFAADEGIAYGGPGDLTDVLARLQQAQDRARPSGACALAIAGRPRATGCGQL